MSAIGGRLRIGGDDQSGGPEGDLADGVFEGRGGNVVAFVDDHQAVVGGHSAMSSFLPSPAHALP